MGNQTDYFEKIGYKPMYFIGDRVFGHYKKIPFVGTCGGEGMVNETEGSLVTVFLDLPLKDGKDWHMTFIKVKPKDLKAYK